tara:strand:+ start:67 stop:495 length:429 start_codon:yes stop_codon:yes gene_type:complete
MNPLNWKKEAAKHSIPFLKKYGKKLIRKVKGGVDMDDIHDSGDMMAHAPQSESFLNKALSLGLELSNPLTGSFAIVDQARGKEGSVLHTALTKQPEIPAIGGFQVGYDASGETDIGRRTGAFLASLPGQVKNAYEDYQLARK